MSDFLLNSIVCFVLLYHFWLLDYGVLPYVFIFCYDSIIIIHPVNIYQHPPCLAKTQTPLFNRNMLQPTTSISRSQTTNSQRIETRSRANLVENGKWDVAETLTARETCGYEHDLLTIWRHGWTDLDAFLLHLNSRHQNIIIINM